MDSVPDTDQIRPRVAVHALFDPAAVGGVQANALSLIHALANRHETSDVSVLALPAYFDAMQALAAPLPVIAWPYGQLPMHPPALANFRQLFAASFDRLRGMFQKGNTASQELDVHGIQVVHFPFQQYFRTKLPFIYEPWDLQHRHLPSFFSPEEISWRDRLYQSGCQDSRLVVTANQWTKNDIVQQYGVAPEKIVVIERGSALFEEMLAGGRLGEKPVKMRENGDFVLFPAFTYRHKNHVRLLQALKLLRDRNLKIPLVCTGRTKGEVWTEIQTTIVELGLSEQVQFLGPVPEEHLIWLYRSATALVFPSLFEGLGLPVLEAMAAGLPVVCGASTCVTDIVGKNGLLFDPYDVNAIASALETAWRDRNALRQSAQNDRERISRYSWRYAAPRFEACYRYAAGVDGNVPPF